MIIVYAPQAIRDLRTIADYLMERSPEAAGKVRNDIQTAIDLAGQFPFSGRYLPNEDARKLISKRYRYVIYYLVDRELAEIQITSIFHPSQDRSKLEK